MRDQLSWLTVFIITLIAMEIFGPKVGIAIIIAELAQMSWRMRYG